MICSEELCSLSINSEESVRNETKVSSRHLKYKETGYYVNLLRLGFQEANKNIQMRMNYKEKKMEKVSLLKIVYYLQDGQL